jgi:hypothetical protein
LLLLYEAQLWLSQGNGEMGMDFWFDPMHGHFFQCMSLE